MNFRKIYIAIISLFIALSCVAPTESIEATAISVTLSLEQTRTQLGEKADGIYPLYWSEGDKISVNGVESAAAVIDAENPSRATFTINDSKIGSRSTRDLHFLKVFLEFIDCRTDSEGLHHDISVT